MKKQNGRLTGRHAQNLAGGAHFFVDLFHDHGQDRGQAVGVALAAFAAAAAAAAADVVVDMVVIVVDVVGGGGGGRIVVVVVVVDVAPVRLLFRLDGNENGVDRRAELHSRRHDTKGKTVTDSAPEKKTRGHNNKKKTGDSPGQSATAGRWSV